MRASVHLKPLWKVWERLRAAAATPWPALALLGLGAGLRLFRLGYKSFWWDEGYSAWMARMPLDQMAAATAHDTHPPLYYALLHGWRALAGDSEFALRLPSVFAGLVLLALGYRLLRGLAGRRAALLGLALLTVTRSLIWYAQEVRQYSLAAALGLASLLLAEQVWRTRGAWRPWLAYVLVTAAGLLSLYLYIGVLAAENLAFLLALRAAKPPRWAVVWRWAAAQVGIAALFVPWLVYYLPRQPHFFVAPATLGLAEVARLYLNALLIGSPWNLDTYWPIMVPGLGLLLLGLSRALRPAAGRAYGWRALAVGALTPVLLVWLLNLPTPLRLTFVPETRYFVTQLAWGTLALGAALAVLSQRWPRLGRPAGALTFITLACFTSGYYNGRYLADDFKSAAATLTALRQPDDVVLVDNDAAWPVIDYHLNQPRIGQSSGQRLADAGEAEKFLKPLWDTHAGLWLLLTPEALLNDPDRQIPRWLAAQAAAVREYRYDPYARLYFFARTPARAASLDELQQPGDSTRFTLAPGLTLINAQWAVPEYRAGETLHLLLDWRNDHAPGEYAFAVRLATLTGQPADEIPASLTVAAAAPGALRQQIDFPLRAYVGPGRYTLSLSAGQTSVALGALTVIAAEAPPRAADPPAQPMNTRFESGLELRGYTLNAAGRRLTLRLDWAAAAPVDQRYKVFLHVWGPARDSASGDLIWAQADHEPAPVTTWPAGVGIADTVTLTLPADAPAGAYTAEVGWYDAFTGQRLLVLDAAGQAVDSQVRFPLGTLTFDR